MKMREFPHDIPKELSAALRRAATPGKVQDLLNGLAMNPAKTCRSPLRVLQAGRAHCMEGAMLAAAAFWYHGAPPLVMDLRTTAKDDDHVVALFTWRGRWGAASKTEHAVLRYRDPVYASPRELAMSYFNEYFLDDGTKTLRSFSVPFDLSRYGSDWLTAREDLWDIPTDLDDARHSTILKKGQARRLRRADALEIRAGKIKESLLRR